MGTANEGMPSGGSAETKLSSNTLFHSAATNKEHVEVRNT